jgi:hypothetical protein
MVTMRNIFLIFMALNLLFFPAYASPPSTALSTGAPAAPPANICGNASILDGPETQPPGSVAVSTSESLPSLVENEPAGTTFYIESGIHYLGSGQFNQVPTKNGDTFIGAPNAIIDGQFNNYYAFVGSSTNVTIEYLTIQNFGPPFGSQQQSEVNQGLSSGWKVLYSTIRGNDGAGVQDAAYNNDSYDCLYGNGQYGYQTSEHNFTLNHDTIVLNDMDNVEQTPYSCGCSGGGKSWISSNGTISDDYVADNFNVGIWVDTDNYNINITKDYILNNLDEGIIYEASYNGRISHDTVIGNAQGGPVGATGFAVPAVYISESGGDGRVSSHNAIFNITNNTLIDNSGGIVLWENSNRHCDDGFDGVCTLGDPAVANSTSCENIPDSESTNPALYWGCRWRTMNDLIENNYEMFNFTKTACRLYNSRAASYCGYAAVFSEDGQPGPYTGERLPWNITYLQNNHFNNNTYVGNWLFDPYNQGESVNLTIWQGKQEWNPPDGGAQCCQFVDQDRNSILSLSGA